MISSLDSQDSTTWDVNPEELSTMVSDRDSGKSVAHLEDRYGGIKGLAGKLKTDLKSGLASQVDEGELKSRRTWFGSNRLEEKKPTSFFQYLFDALKDETLIILMISAVVSIILECSLENANSGWIEGTAILCTVFIVASVTAANDVSKDKQFRALSEISEDIKTKVRRDGKVEEISIFDVVVGDIVELRGGDQVPADLVFISGHSVVADESSMTGESEPVHKNHQNIFLLAGTNVVEGDVTGMAVAVGVHSQWGKIKMSLMQKDDDEEDDDDKTPLQEKLEDLAELIGKIGLAAAVITFFALLIRWIIADFAIDHNDWDWSYISDIVSFLIIGITILVVAVPEGLPLAVTLSLAYSMMRMMKDQCLVRHLVACETMGSATCICSDKTGTLTQNKMTVVKLWISEQTFEDIAVHVPEPNTSKINERGVELLCNCSCINSKTFITVNNGKQDFSGTKTEGALLVMADKFGYKYETLRENAKVLRLYPFSSANKRMSTVVEASNGARLYCKGASEVVLAECNTVLDAHGSVQQLNQDHKLQLRQLIDTWASQGLRTLSIAYRDFSQAQVSQLKLADEEVEVSDLDTDMTLVAIVAIEDPVREEVPRAIQQCKRAGITVRMVTGDNILTAKNIGTQCGILTADGIAIEGPDFRKMSSEEIDKILPKLQIIARCSPQDKLILVKHLREHGEVVGATGDGTNDAPILREADVGFAMGISGTDVAKSAADVIILDDNFASIEKAVLWGRNVYDSIRKFIQFQSTVNAVALIIAFVGAIALGDSPLNAVQLLWVNLIMDTLAALALATEAPNEKLLDRPPHGRSSSLITKLMWRTIIGGALLQIAILFMILFSDDLIDRLADDDASDGDKDDLRNTLIFNVFVLMQLFNEINCRKLENDKNVFERFFSNSIFLGVLGVTFAVQFILVTFSGPFAQTISLDWRSWLFCVGISFTVLPWGILVRFIPVPGANEENNNNNNQPNEEQHLLAPKAGKPKHYSAVDQL